MRVTETALPGVLLFEPVVHGDHRGFFLESWRHDRYADHGVTLPFVQDNHSKSTRGTLRGLHTQTGSSAQGKLVRVVAGRVYDVAVDIRVGSPTFGRYVAVELTAENHRQIWVPPHFAHGFCVLSESAEFEYKCTAYYDPGADLAIRWDDPAIGIPWPISDPVLSAKDRDARTLAEAHDQLPSFEA